MDFYGKQAIEAAKKTKLKPIKAVPVKKSAPVPLKKSANPSTDAKQPLRNARTSDEPVSLVKEAPKTLNGGMLNRGGYVKLPEINTGNIKTPEALQNKLESL